MSIFKFVDISFADNLCGVHVGLDEGLIVDQEFGHNPETAGNCLSGSGGIKRRRVFHISTPRYSFLTILNNLTC